LGTWIWGGVSIDGHRHQHKVVHLLTKQLAMCSGERPGHARIQEITGIIKKHPAVSVQDSLTAAFDPSTFEAQQNEGRVSQMQHHQQPSQPPTQFQHRPLHADVAILQQALQVICVMRVFSTRSGPGKSSQFQAGPLL
jgi:hypothetical protein